MEQAALLAVLGGLYEKLVKDVAAQVIATMAERPVVVTDDPREMRAIAVAVFEELIESALEQYDPSDLVQSAIDDLDLDSELDEKVDTAIENFDFEDKIKAAVQELRFEVSVR